AGTRVEIAGVLLEDGRRVVLRIDRQRDDEDIAADAIAEQVLHPRQVRGGPRTRAGAAGEREVDQDLLAFHQVVVEAHRPAVVCLQRQVRKVPPHALGARRLAIERWRLRRRLGRDAGPPGHQRADRGHPEPRERMASVVHPDVFRLHGTTSKISIMRMSSCSRLWQWNTYLPMFFSPVQYAATRTVSFGPRLKTSLSPASCGAGAWPLREMTANSSS